ncbi:MAG: multidrug transporter, partial [Flavobacteriales bacterium]|nr:multidrug transporter [Flavobacteriales bacterium]
NMPISLPWQPVSIIGIAVAFYLGFKNNSSYDRLWEARKIWGGIVNNSRSLGAAVISFVQGENDDEVKKELIYRHIAWFTALRHQLRLSKEWEHTEERIKGMYSPTICEDYHNRLDGELAQFITKDEIDSIEPKSNTATQLLAIQSKRLQELKDLNYFDDFRHMEFHQLMVSLYEDQGKSERIKNFPFPRQYASTTIWLNLVFSLLLPLAMLDIFKGSENSLTFWICPIASGLIIWIYHLMEKIGDYSENPFEGTYNDVPITSISRGIEIDLREMINDTNIPKPIQAENGFLL